LGRVEGYAMNILQELSYLGGAKPKEDQFWKKMDTVRILRSNPALLYKYDKMVTEALKTPEKFTTKDNVTPLDKERMQNFAGSFNAEQKNSGKDLRIFILVYREIFSFIVINWIDQTFLHFMLVMRSNQEMRMPGSRRPVSASLNKMKRGSGKKDVKTFTVNKRIKR
jgi:hypothetical protein